MHRIILDYDPANGNISDAKGSIVGNWQDLLSTSFKDNSGVDVESICKLKNAGFSAEEIIEMKRKEVL